MAYYELDLAGNVSGLRGPSGTNFGAYRYSAFGQTLVDTTTIIQSLRWKGRWHSSIAGGIYDVRARQWAPELGLFTSIDAYAWHDGRTTLWGWPGQNPIAFSDPTGEGRSECEGDRYDKGPRPPKPPPPPKPPTPPKPPEPPLPPQWPEPKGWCTSNCKAIFENELSGCAQTYSPDNPTIESCKQDTRKRRKDCIWDCTVNGFP